ncbi:MAG: hypothetical protein WKG07_41260 [Hymenobacter sp.]
MRRVAGVGSSGVAQYGGSGAYFLDWLAPGTWRLEVMPDAVPLSDPFATASLHKVVTDIVWNEQPLTLHLPDLGPEFLLRGLNKGNKARALAVGGRLPVRPGTCLLTKSHDASVWPAQKTLGVIGLTEFVAPWSPYPINSGRAVAGPVAPARAAGYGRAAARYHGHRQRPSLPSGRQYSARRAALLWPHAHAAHAARRRRHGNGYRARGPYLPRPAALLGSLEIQTRATHYAARPGIRHPARLGFCAGRRALAGAAWRRTAPLPLFTAATDHDAVEAKALTAGAYVDYPTAADGALAVRFVVPLPPPGQPAPALAAGPAVALRAYLGLKMGVG